MNIVQVLRMEEKIAGIPGKIEQDGVNMVQVLRQLEEKCAMVLVLRQLEGKCAAIRGKIEQDGGAKSAMLRGYRRAK